MRDNRHTDEQLDQFAREQLAIIKEQEEALIQRIREFHEGYCVAPVAARENCTNAFIKNFMLYMIYIQEEQSEG